ncbi:MAG: ABC transporter ATP-binding protein [Nitrosopumilus sp.]|nr:ABC transporter ATP-binding protein [Nitrosopumilus sp.]
MVTNDILKIKNLTKKFSNFVAVDNLSLDVKKNSCIGFLGPNGAGKTTTLKILTGLLRPTSGAAQINGYDVTKNFRKAMLGVGAVVETPEFYPHFTPDDVLSYFGRLRGMSHQEVKGRIQKVLDEVNMSEWSNKKIGKFSKGMKQRIAIASALLHEPQLIILDEPVSGLDPRGMMEVREIIKAMKKQGKTIFMSSHLLVETQAICDEVALIDKGKLLGLRSISDLQTSSKSKIKIEMIENPTDFQLDAIKNFPQISDVLQDTSNVITVDFEGDKSNRADFLKFLHDHSIQVISFSLVETSLENIYKELISDSVR